MFAVLKNKIIALLIFEGWCFDKLSIWLSIGCGTQAGSLNNECSAHAELLTGMKLCVGGVVRALTIQVEKRERAMLAWKVTALPFISQIAFGPKPDWCFTITHQYDYTYFGPKIVFHKLASSKIQQSKRCFMTIQVLLHKKKNKHFIFI